MAPQARDSSDWKVVDRELRRLAHSEAALDYEVGCWLLAARRTEVYRHLGYATLAQYVERLFGYDGRKLRERLRVAEALEQLPETEAELRRGQRSWSAVRELTRVAAPATEREWLASTRGRTVREIEQLVAGLPLGARPRDPKDPALRKYVLRLEVTAEGKALFREVIARVQAESGESLGEDEAFLQALRQVLRGPGDPGRSPYQIALTVCLECQRNWQQGRGELVEVPPIVTERASCDAQEVALTHVGRGTDAVAARARQSVPPATRRLVVRRDGGRCRVPGCRNADWVEVHHLDLRSEGGTHDPDRLLLLCGAHHDQLHEGVLHIEGTVQSGLRFRHADGTIYGELPAAESVQVFTEVFETLRRLGYKEREARAAVAAARSQVGSSPARAELLRAALRACPSPAFVAAG